MFSNSNSFAAGDAMDRLWETFPLIVRMACPGHQAQA